MNLNLPKFQFVVGLGMLLLSCLTGIGAFAQQDTVRTQEQDTSYQFRTNPLYPTFQLRDRHGDPFSNYTTESPFYLKDPKGLSMGVELDTGFNYTITEKLGNINYRPSSSLSFSEFNQYHNRLMLKDYWRGKMRALDGESAVSSRNLIPKIYVSPVLDRIFGGSYIDLIPRGSVTLDFGAQFQRIENPSIPLRQQRNGGFEFDQQIDLNVTGKVGEKLAVTTNFNNNNSFDFQNNFKIEYTGFKEDILKKLEIGNVSLPLNNSLITGAQNLFGLKAQMQFGKLFVTSIATTQRGKQSSIEIQGSTNGTSQGRPFEIVGSNYDENRHFFLSQFFRDNFENWLSTLPQITSGVNITRVEVYLLNRQNDTQTLRNIVGFMDMGETTRIYRKDLLNTSGTTLTPTANSNNNLFTSYLNSIDRTSDAVAGALDAIGFVAGTDYERITSARKLAPTEYSFHKELGYLTLQRKLQNDEALAVAFEYTYNGRAYKVGELTEDYSNLEEDKVIFLKLLRPRKINIKDTQGNVIPTWNLMMKNIYSLNVSQLTRDGFQLRVIYRDDRTGIDNPQLQEGEVARTRQLIEALGLDRLNPYNDPQPDGNFDYVDKVTIIPETGLIVFPFLEPFNKGLRNLFALETNPATRDFLINKYVYDTLYRTTKAEAELVATKNKFFIVGSFKAGSGKEIVIQGFNIAQGSVKVYAGGTPLREGSDYTVDYTFGKVVILNEGILTSGKNISITYEQQDPFAFQTRTLLGSRFDYKLSEDVNIGSTLLYYNERPLITRNAIGNEPARNLQYGFDLNVRKNSRLLTKMVDALPFLQTKETSTVTFSGEFAQLLPGTSNNINGDGTSFIDDFENSATPFNFITPINWRLAATPTRDPQFDLASGASNDLRASYRRAKLAWYQVDNIFYRRGGALTPPDINTENHYQRAVEPREIFPGFDPFVGNFFEPVLDLAFFPAERGQYNYNPDLNSDGTLRNPVNSWAGITTAIRSEVDFDKANIEYLEFWMMDPFIKGTNGRILDGKFNSNHTSGGELTFHLGSISEDIMRDGKHAFENGLPTNGDVSSGVQPNEWGYVTTQQYLNAAFANETASRPNQDIGLDGLSSANEPNYQSFQPFLNALSPDARQAVIADVSADDFEYFLGDEFDDREAQIVERYRNFNGMENNSPVLTGSEQIPRSGTTIPDNEDLNQDNTMSDLEEYYSYTINLRDGQLEVGRNFIVDKITPEEFGGEVTWYLFRIPVRQFDAQVGDINGFKSIRYVRTILHGFTEPVVLRMAKFRAIGNKWRRYTGNLEESKFGEPLEPNLDNFTVSTVNVEENSAGNEIKPPYIPPLDRDRDVTSVQNRRLNEQSVQLCANDLQDGDARSIFKNVTMDFFNYGRIKMFLSAYSSTGQAIGDGELKAFVRIGTDFDQNYYEVDVPLKITRPTANSVQDVWPEENEIDIALNDLYALKTRRDRESYPLEQLYPLAGPEQAGKHGIRILGRPDLSQVRLIMIGIRNPKTSDGRSLNICLWANEMRLTDFDRTAGWAANAVINTKLADLGTVTGSFRHIGFGYGGVQSKISERARGETNAYDVSANVNVDKLLPQALGLRIPMFASYETTTIDPKYDPANPDVRIEAALQSFETDAERDAYRRIIQDRTVRRSLNFTNVRKVKVKPDARTHIWDIENFAFTYAFSEATQTSFNLRENTRRNVKGAVSWQYSPTFKGFEPFKNAKGLKSPYLQLIKEFNFNPMPTSIAVRGELDRAFNKMVYRNSIADQASALPNYSKYFVFNRFYNARWNLTKALTIEYASTVNAIIDEPDGDIDTREKRDSVINNLKRFGRMKNFTQNITANYAVPLDKFPITNWLGADYRYNVGYAWRAGPVEQVDSLKLGNVIQNTQDQGINGKVDFLKLYNKIGFLKDINTPKRRPSPVERAKQRPSPTDTVKRPPELRAVKGFLRLLMSLRSITGTYTLNQGTTLAGFQPSPYLFGMDKGYNAPGWGFILGSQNPDIRFRAADRGWITTSNKLTTPFSQLQTKDLNLRASVEPTPDFKIQLDVKKTVNNSFQEIFRYDSGEFQSLNPSRTGSYKISILSIRTALKNNSSTESTVFQQFTQNISTINDRFSAVGQGYESRSQDVLIPAFIAAYTGRSAQSVSLSPFPNVPIPNWRVDYSGLNKIQAFKDIFQSITINHAYVSSYQVLSYSNSLEYTNVGINIPVEDYNRNQFASQQNEQGQLIPVYVISQVMISEQFQPLVGINLRTKSRLNLRFDYKTKRDLALNISNAQVTELASKDWSVEVGYTKNNMKLPFKDQGRTITLKNDVTFRLNVSITNNRTIQRKIDEVNTITNGNINVQIRPNVQYVVNQKLNVQFYVDRNVNEPLVTSSFRRATTRVGLKLVFNLAQ